MGAVSSSQKDGLAFDQRRRGQQLETRNGIDDHASGPGVDFVDLCGLDAEVKWLSHHWRL